MIDSVRQHLSHSRKEIVGINTCRSLTEAGRIGDFAREFNHIGSHGKVSIGYHRDLDNASIVFGKEEREFFSIFT